MQELVKGTLEELFGLTIQVNDKTLKVHVKVLNGNDIWNLTDIYSNRGVKEIILKRSGTGITIIVETE